MKSKINLLVGISIFFISPLIFAQPRRIARLQDQILALQEKIKDIEKNLEKQEQKSKENWDDIQTTKQELKKIKQEIKMLRLEQKKMVSQSKLNRLKNKVLRLETKAQEIEKAELVGYKDGFFIQSKDKRFSLTLNGISQLGYRFKKFKASSKTTDPELEAPRLYQDNSFFVRNTKISLKGNLFFEALRFKIKFNLVSSLGKEKIRISNLDEDDTYYIYIDYRKYPFLDDAYIEYKRYPYLWPRLGQFKVPYNRQRLAAPSKLQFVDPSLANKRFNLNRDIGITLNSTLWDLLEANIGAFNGNGKNTLKNDNIDFLLVARFEIEPFGKVKEDESALELLDSPRLSIGAAFAFNLIANEFEASSTGYYNHAEYNFTADLLFKFYGLSLSGAFFYLRRDYEDIEVPKGVALEEWGMYSQAGFFILKKYLEICMRLSIVDPDTKKGEDQNIEGTGGINFFLLKQKLKLQANYSRLLRQKFGEKDIRHGHKVMVQAQFMF